MCGDVDADAEPVLPTRPRPDRATVDQHCAQNRVVWRRGRLPVPKRVEQREEADTTCRWKTRQLNARHLLKALRGVALAHSCPVGETSPHVLAEPGEEAASKFDARILGVGVRRLYRDNPRSSRIPAQEQPACRRSLSQPRIAAAGEEFVGESMQASARIVVTRQPTQREGSNRLSMYEPHGSPGAPHLHEVRVLPRGRLNSLHTGVEREQRCARGRILEPGVRRLRESSEREATRQVHRLETPHNPTVPAKLREHSVTLAHRSDTSPVGRVDGSTIRA